MRRLLARARRAVALFLHPRNLLVQEDVCWCGIHHLGGYVHVPGPVTGDLSPVRRAAVAGFVAAAVRDAQHLEGRMARANGIIARTEPIDTGTFLAKCGVLTDENLQKASALVAVARAGSPPPQPLRFLDRQIAQLEAAEAERVAREDELWLEAIARNNILDQLEAVRHRDRTHPATPDTYFWGITTAERIIRGDHP